MYLLRKAPMATRGELLAAETWSLAHRGSMLVGGE
jgi:hypothetical protein